MRLACSGECPNDFLPCLAPIPHAVTMIHPPEKLESLTDATADGLLTLYFSA